MFQGRCSNVSILQHQHPTHPASRNNRSGTSWLASCCSTNRIARVPPVLLWALHGMSIDYHVGHIFTTMHVWVTIFTTPQGVCSCQTAPAHRQAMLGADAHHFDQQCRRHTVYPRRMLWRVLGDPQNIQPLAHTASGGIVGWIQPDTLCIWTGARGWACGMRCKCGFLHHHIMRISRHTQTGSGKTHTMLGNEDEYGLLQMAVQQLFTSLHAKQSEGWQCTTTLSALEVWVDMHVHMRIHTQYMWISHTLKTNLPIPPRSQFPHGHHLIATLGMGTQV